MQKTFTNYLKNLYLASNFKKNVDFEVVSLLAVKQDKKFESIDSFFGLDSMKYLHNSSSAELLRYVQTKIGPDENVYLIETPIKDSHNAFHFYKLDVEIAMDIAVSLGLGVVRMLTENLYEEYLFYSISQVYHSIPNHMDHLYDEWMRIKIYTQLLRMDDYYDQDLEEIWKTDASPITKRIMSNPTTVMPKLNALYS